MIDWSSPEFVAAYDELPLWSAMFGLLLLDEVPLAGVANVLDAGCGTGFPLIELAERLGPRAQVHGIDTWSAALRRAAEKVRVRNTPNVTLHEGSAASMPFADATFDLIVSNLGINNFDDRRAVLAECRRVVRPDGVLALTTNLRGHMQELYVAFDGVLQRLGFAAQLDALAAHVNHRATVDGLRELLGESGFHLTRVVERSATMRFANANALFRHHFIRIGFLDAWRDVAADAADAADDVFAELERELDTELRLTIPMAYVEARVE